MRWNSAILLETVRAVDGCKSVSSGSDGCLLDLILVLENISKCSPSPELFLMMPMMLAKNPSMLPENTL